MQMFFFFNPLMPRPLNVSLLSAGALQIENSEESDQGKYECVASNSAGTRYSAPANLYVRGKVKQSWVFKLWITPFTPVCWVQTQHLDNAVQFQQLLIRGIVVLPLSPGNPSSVAPVISCLVHSKVQMCFNISGNQLRSKLTHLDKCVLSFSNILTIFFTNCVFSLLLTHCSSSLMD